MSLFCQNKKETPRARRYFRHTLGIPARKNGNVISTKGSRTSLSHLLQPKRSVCASDL